MNLSFHNVRGILSAAGLALGVYAMPAPAVPINPGDTVALAGTTSAARPELAGDVLVDTIRPFSIDLGGGLMITGSVQDRVVRSDADGTLDFYYRLFNDVDSSGTVDFVVREVYTGFSTDVDFRTDGLGTIGPDQAFRLAGSGEEVRFDFLADTVGPGEESRLFFIKTDATQYNDSGLGFIGGFGFTGGGSTATISSYQPAVVPVPAAVWLFGSGLLGLIGVAQRRRVT